MVVCVCTKCLCDVGYLLLLSLFMFLYGMEVKSWLFSNSEHLEFFNPHDYQGIHHTVVPFWFSEDDDDDGLVVCSCGSSFCSSVCADVRSDITSGGG